MTQIKKKSRTISFRPAHPLLSLAAAAAARFVFPHERHLPAARAPTCRHLLPAARVSSPSPRARLPSPPSLSPSHPFRAPCLPSSSSSSAAIPFLRTRHLPASFLLSVAGTASSARFCRARRRRPSPPLLASCRVVSTPSLPADALQFVLPLPTLRFCSRRSPKARTCISHLGSYFWWYDCRSCLMMA